MKPCYSYKGPEEAEQSRVFEIYYRVSQTKLEERIMLWSLSIVNHTDAQEVVKELILNGTEL